MSILTKEQLAQMIPGNPYVADWHEALEILLPDYEIDTPQRVAAFVAQCAHESGNFRTLKENLNYRAVTLRKCLVSISPRMILLQHMLVSKN
jgi:putative chitinase